MNQVNSHCQHFGNASRLNPVQAAQSASVTFTTILKRKENRGYLFCVPLLYVVLDAMEYYCSVIMNCAQGCWQLHLGVSV